MVLHKALNQNEVQTKKVARDRFHKPSLGKRKPLLL